MQVRSVLYETAHRHWERSKLTFATTPIPFSSTYKPGGTFIVTSGSTTGRVRQQHRDKWGRWVAQELSDSNSSTVIVISAYQPVNKNTKEGTTVIVISAYQRVDKNTKEGTNSVASQHRSLLLQSSDTTDNPRTAFRRDLLQQLQAYRQDKM